MGDNKNYDRENKKSNKGADVAEALLFNGLGLAPTEGKFFVTNDNMRKYIKEFASAKLDGVHDVSIYIDEYHEVERPDRKGKKRVAVPIAYLWLKADSDDLVDKDAKRGDTIIRSNIPNISQNLKTFATNYGGVEPKKMHLYDGRGNDEIKGFPIDLGKMCESLFDIFNNEFKKQNPGAQGLPKWALTVETVPAKGDGKRDDDITGFVVTKFQPTPYNRQGEQPRPKKSHSM